MKTLIGVLCGLLLGLNAILAQQISGTVYEHTNVQQAALIGANVYWLGTTEGTSTDFDGNFEIARHKKSDTLLISYIGYQTDTVAVAQTQNAPLEIVLQSNTKLDEIKITRRQKGVLFNKMSALNSTTLTSAELKKAACCNLSESFSTNASVDVSFTDAISGAKQVQLLGLSGRYVQLLTESMPNYNGLASNFGLTYIPGSWLKSIQITKGATQIANGYEAMSGQINVEYKKPEDLEVFYLNAYGSSTGRAELNINTAHQVNENWSTLLLSHFNHNRLHIDQNNDGFLDLPLTTQANLMNRWRYAKGNIRYQAGLKFLQEDRRAGQATFDFEKKPADQNHYGIQYQTTRWENFHKIGYLFTDDAATNIALQSQLVHHNQDAFWGRKQYDAQQWSSYLNLLFITDFQSDMHKLQAGASHRSDKFQEEQNILKFDLNRTERVLGFFAQYAFSWQELLLSSGVRLDQHNLFGKFVTPRLNLRYNLTPSTTLKASWGKGFRSTNLLADNVNLLATNRTIIEPKQRQLEEATNWGVSLLQEMELLGKPLKIQADFYRTRFQNQLVADLDHSPDHLHLRNVDKGNYSNIFQVELHYEFVRGMQAMAAFRHNDVQMYTLGAFRQKALASRYIGLGNISYTTPLKRWQFDYTLSLHGDGRLPYSNPEENRKFDSFIIQNVQVTRKYKAWEFYAGAENLANFTQAHPILKPETPFEKGFDASQVWGPVLGRNIYVGIRYNLQ